MEISSEALQQYEYALRKGKKTLFHARMHKEDPYLKSLDSIADANKLNSIDLGQIEVPSHLIVGTKTQARATSFSSDFMPLLNDKSEFAAKWINVCRYHLSDTGINEAPTAYEYLGRFYIEEGNKRVSVLKSYGAPFITLEVRRLMPEKTDDPEISLYYEFLEFYKLSKLYSLQFSKPGYYKRFLKYVHMEEDHEWTRRERIVAVGYFERLSAELDKKGVHTHHPDCLVALLEMYTYEFLVGMSDKELDKIISEHKVRLSHGKGFYNIECISDDEDQLLYSSNVRHILKDTDFIISAGDLKKEYLEYIVTLTDKPLFYIHGNHDGLFIENPPEGCICIDDDLVTYDGIRIMGLGGSCRYSNDYYQYTELQMKQRIRKLKHKIRKAGGVDIIVTHAPIKGYGELDDYAHQGFECFRKLLEDEKPKFWFYGHVHTNYEPFLQRVHAHKNTMIINVSGRYRVKY